ncbi:MAG: hypothetical protein QG657_3656 [Acidobacteriota bacterium]|nr:hypothetical protein [Acidobacteriota bacterium]
MKYKISGERKQFLVKLMKEVGKGFIILIAVVLAFKFMNWNSFKLDQTVAIAGEISKEPSAVNLVVSGKSSPLFQKSFAYNEKGNYYIINRFDIDGQISDMKDMNAGNIHITLNGQDITSFLVFRFKRFNILYTGGYYFAFTTADSGIEDLVELDRSFLDIENSLFKLAVARKGAEGKQEDEKEIIYQCFQGVEKELTYGSAKISIPLPGVFNKGKLYEIIFHYKVTGGAKAVVMLSPASNPHELDTVVEGSYRKVSILFSPREVTASPVLYLLGRNKVKKGPFDGAVSFKDISIYRYGQEYPWLKEFHGSHVAYFDSVDRLKEEFVGVKYFQK